MLKIGHVWRTHPVGETEVVALRDVNLAQLEAARELMPELSYKRALHVVGENERVLAGVALLRGGDARGFGKLMAASHESSQMVRRDLEYVEGARDNTFDESRRLFRSRTGKDNERSPREQRGEE